jgi:hypothetical protein
MKSNLILIGVMALASYGSSLTYAQAVIVSGSCGDTETATPGHPNHAACSYHFTCGNNFPLWFRGFRIGPFTDPFACDVGNTTHTASGQAVLTDDEGTSQDKIVAAGNGETTFLRQGTQICQREIGGFTRTVVVDRPANCP